MTDYEAEHGIKPTVVEPATMARPDMSTFFAHIDQISRGTSEHAVPEPNELLAAFRLVVDGFSHIRRNQSDDTPESQLLDNLIAELQHQEPELDGVPDTFLDDHMLPTATARKRFKESDSCPICNDAFLDEPKENNILAIRLPCHTNHVFHKECIGPWLKLKRTCPLDRKIVYEKKKPVPIVQDEEEEDYDDMYS